MANERPSKRRYVICVKNDKFVASLEVCKLYSVIPDKTSEKQGLVRVIDESGRDYLYPENWFIPVDLSAPVRRALARARRRERPVTAAIQATKGNQRKKEGRQTSTRK